MTGKDEEDELAIVTGEDEEDELAIVTGEDEEDELAIVTGEDEEDELVIMTGKDRVSDGLVVNWLVQARRPGHKDWATMYNAHDSEELAREQYAKFLASKQVTGSVLQYRLTRRTAVITDEVIEHDTQDAPVIPEL